MIYSATWLICVPLCVVINIVALCRCTCGAGKQTPNPMSDNGNYYHFAWFYMLNFFIIIAHIYQVSITTTFIVAKLHPSFPTNLDIAFRYITGVLAVRFMVSIIFAAGPIILVPSIRNSIFPKGRPTVSRHQQSPDSGGPGGTHAGQITVKFES